MKSDVHRQVNNLRSEVVTQFGKVYSKFDKLQTGQDQMMEMMRQMMASKSTPAPAPAPSPKQQQQQQQQNSGTK
jgi:hypothetical protein